MLLGRNHSCARTRFVMCEARRASACPHVRAQCLASDSLQHKNVASEPAIRKQAFMRPMQGVEVLNKVLKCREPTCKKRCAKMQQQHRKMRTNMIPNALKRHATCQHHLRNQPSSGYLAHLAKGCYSWSFAHRPRAGTGVRSAGELALEDLEGVFRPVIQARHQLELRIRQSHPAMSAQATSRCSRTASTHSGCGPVGGRTCKAPGDCARLMVPPSGAELRLSRRGEASPSIPHKG